MAYLSDVSLVLKRNLFNKIMEQTRDTSTRLVNLSHVRVNEDSILLVWNQIQWDSNDPETDVGKFWAALEKFADSENDFYLVDMGEDPDDSQFVGGYWNNPWKIGIKRVLSWDNKVGKELFFL